MTYELQVPKKNEGYLFIFGKVINAFLLYDRDEYPVHWHGDEVDGDEHDVDWLAKLILLSTPVRFLFLHPQIEPPPEQDRLNPRHCAREEDEEEDGGGVTGVTVAVQSTVKRLNKDWLWS